MNLFRTHNSTAESPLPKKRKKVPQDALEWCQEAEKAEDGGDWSRAVVCYRRALQLAPFCTEIREAFENALDQQIMESIHKHLPKDDVLFAPLFGLTPAGDEDDEEKAKPAAKKAAPAPPRRATTRRNDPPRFTLRRLAMPMVFGAAMLLTGAGLYAAASAATFIGKLFGNESLPTISEPQMPAELLGRLSAANEMLTAEDAEKAVAALRDAKEDFPTYGEQIDPALARALRVQGIRARSTNNPADAAAIFREVAELDPGNSLNWIDLGRTLRDHARSSAMTRNPAQQRELLAEAEKAYQEALEISSNDTAALLGLAQVYDAKNDRVRATEAYEKLAAAAPESSREGEAARTALMSLRRR